MTFIKIEFSLPIKLIKKSDKEEKLTSISSLAPKILTEEDELEKVQPYLDKLKDTLSAKGINNIALTGGYGSGKSTLLKTFQHWNENEFNFLNISLAAFNQNKTKENFKELYELKIKNGKTEKEAEKEISNEFKETLISNDELEKQLEISILQQIIYKVKPSKLPESRFKRIVNIPNWKLWFLIPFCFILWILSLILLFKYKYLNNLNPNLWIYKNDIDWISIIIFFIAFLGIGYFSKLVVELFSNSKINKVNLKGEIEIGDNSNKSILNEHYDEILYYFEKNDFNVVVIEDLDRFDNTNIFTKLRELNILLNNADSIRNKSAYKNFGIKFLYAVGDDLFNDKKERVKFFEYIIPVIPFINSSNANDQLKTLIKESELEENVFPKEFISDITTFIDDIDMRLLVNIFHEFVIYRNVLNHDVIKGREVQLFAMITYKNIDPEDFNKLNSKEGKLYKLINNKKFYIKSLIKALDNNISIKRNEIDNIKFENISEIKELKPIYILKISEKIIGATELNIKERRLRFSDLMSDDIFNEVLKTNNFRYYQNGNGVYNSNISFDNIQSEVNPDKSYEERVKLIESKHNNQIDKLQKDIEKLKSQKFEIENWDLKQIFKEVDINQYLNDFSNNGLLRNLILEGYINESYNDYISLFHEVSLTKEDKKFERNVKSGVNEGFEFKLTNVENLIDNNIELKYFQRETILNFDLINHLGRNYFKYSEKYDTVIKLLSNEKEISIDFIDQYISDDRRPLKIFIEKLVKNWEGFWDYVYLRNKYSQDKKDKYLSLIIQYGSIDDIMLSQNNNSLSTAISEKTNFLSLIKNTSDLNYFDKITKLIEKLNVKFEELQDPDDDTIKLFEFIYNNNYYQINKMNVQQMIRLFGNVGTENDFDNSNYTTVLNSDCKPLIEYINSNINVYIKDLFLKMKENKFDNEDSLLKLLNNMSLQDILKIEVIEKISTKIENLIKIEKPEIKRQLLIHNKVFPTWTNVINYFTTCDNVIDENLATFLSFENVYIPLSENIIPKSNETFNDETLEVEILKNSNISDESYLKLITSSCKYKWKTLDFSQLNKSKIVHLIQKRLATSKENYDLLKEYFPHFQINLIEKNFNAFIINLKDFETEENDILMILKSEKISLENKFKYINEISQQTILDNKDISKNVGEIILRKSKSIELEVSTLNNIIINLDTTENKVNLVLLYFIELTSDDIISLVRGIGYYYSELFVKQHKPLLNNNYYNRDLLSKLESKGMINSYGTYSKDNTKIRAVANY